MRHVAVIGAGIAGAAAARALAQAGVRCTVLEAGSPSCGASGAAAGILQPVTGRLARLAPWHAAGFALSVMQIEAARAWRCRGVLRVAMSDEQASQWRERASKLPTDIARWVERDEALALAGGLSPQARGAIYIARGGAADIPALVHWMLQEPAITVHERCAVTGIESRPGSVTLHLNTQGATRTLVVDGVLIAAGNGSPALVRDLGLRWDARRARGELLVARSSHVPQMVISSGGYVVPQQRAGEILIGATFDETNPDAGATDEGRRALLARAAHLLPAETQLDEVRCWAGIRPATGDRIPRAGLLPGQARIALCTGLGAKGLLLGLLAATWSARALIRGERDLVPERWRRFEPV